MKQSSVQKVRSRKGKFQFLTHNHTTVSSPIDNKYTVNGQQFDSIKNNDSINTGMRRFNVRRLNKTQQSVTKTKQKNKQSDESSFTFQKLLRNKQTQNIKTVKPLQSQILKEKLKTLTNTLDVKRTKVRPPRVETQHSSLVNRNQKSPYLHKYKFRTIQSQIQKSNRYVIDDDLSSQKRKRYSFMTKFQLEQVQKYEVFYAGQRRIPSIKHFTDAQGNAKISIGDSIVYRYQIKSCIGQGSFGQVYRSYDHKKKQEIAIKIIKNHPKFNKQAKIQIRILQTVLMHDNNSHYNIIKLKHAFFFRGHACLVFELLHINLYEFMRLNQYKGLCIDLIRRIAIQILQGLMFFQKFNIVHCDLKPQNILLKQENKTGIKIIDVGSGTFQEEQVYTYIQSRFYRAPEIILGIRYSAKIDIWSFGCILCELYTGYPLFPGENEQELIQMIMQVIGVPPKEVIDRGSRSNKFFQQYKPKVVANSKGKIRNAHSKPLSKKLRNCQDKSFISFIEKCFKWIPEERFRPNEALLDEWILQGLPEQIRQQHIDIVCQQKFQTSTS